jgi:hypothetical protein
MSIAGGYIFFVFQDGYSLVLFHIFLKEFPPEKAGTMGKPAGPIMLNPRPVS